MALEVRGRVLAWHYAWIDQLRISWPAGVPFSANAWEVFSREQIVWMGKRACEQSGVTVDDLEVEGAYGQLRELFAAPRSFERTETR